MSRENTGSSEEFKSKSMGWEGQLTYSATVAPIYPSTAFLPVLRRSQHANLLPQNLLRPFHPVCQATMRSSVSNGWTDVGRGGKSSNRKPSQLPRHLSRHPRLRAFPTSRWQLLWNHFLRESLPFSALLTQQPWIELDSKKRSCFASVRFAEHLRCTRTASQLSSCVPTQSCVAGRERYS